MPVSPGGPVTEAEVRNLLRKFHPEILAAIEAEARAAALRELREEVEGMQAASPSGVCIFRATILAAIDRRLAE